MNCSMCGARVPEGRSSCVQCGAPVGRAPGATLAAAPSYAMTTDAPRVCPRCGNAGVSISYFANGFHILALLALTLFSGGVLGVAYVFFRAGYRICPTCSQTWGKGGYMAPALAPGSASAALATEEVVGADGVGKRSGAYAMWVFAAFMIMGGIAGGEVVPIMMALMAAAGGFLLFRSASEDRRLRREALIQKLQLPVLQLAGEMGGQLTVTQVAGKLGWSLPRAEKVLQSLEDGYRVMGDVTDQGVIVYNFLELVNAPPPVRALQHAPPPGDDDTRLMA